MESDSRPALALAPPRSADRTPRCPDCGRPRGLGDRIGDAGYCSSHLDESRAPFAYWYRRDCATARDAYARGQRVGHEAGRRSVAGIVQRMIRDEEDDETILRVVGSVAAKAGAE